MEKESNLIASKDIMKQIHNCTQEILDYFVKLCQENKLKYYLAGGTLLGAVRHKGPIPWDDDIDIYMPRDDMEKLKKILLENKEEKYHIHYFENEPTFKHFHLQINKTGTVYKTESSIEVKRKYSEIWIDIFPLDDSPRINSIKDKIFGNFIIFLKDGWENKIEKMHNKSLKRKIAYIFFLFLPDRFIKYYGEKCMCKNNGKGYDYYANWTGKCPFPNNIMPKNWFEPAVELAYSGKYYKAPYQWDKVLTMRYGNYMELPPENERMGHRPIEVKIDEK